MSSQRKDGAFGLGIEHRRPYRLRLARYQAAAEVIEAHVGGRPALALDAGVGRGRIGRVACSKGLRWVGLDISPSRLAKAAATQRYALVRASIDALPFASSRFDVVCCVQVLEHFREDEARAITEALGALVRPGGLLLLSVPLFPPGVVPLIAAARRLLDWAERPYPGDHLSHFDLRRALALVPRDFTPTDVRGVRLFSLLGAALEGRRWWYRAHAWAGRRFPAWTIEVNIAATRPRTGSDQRELAAHLL